MENKKNTFAKIGFNHALKGIQAAAAQEHNFKIHLAIAAVAIGAGFVLHVSLTEWLFLTCAIMAVLTAELFNTAVEKLCDRVTTEFDLKIGFVKDAAAAAVLITVIFAAIIGIVIFLPKVLKLFAG